MARFLEFHGIFPRITEDNLPPNSATVANDVNLRSGRLEPWRERLALAEAPESALTMHQHGCCYYTWDTCVSVAEYLPDYNSMFITGRRGYPERAVFGDNCSLTYYRLGVPKPAGTPSVSSASENGAGKIDIDLNAGTEELDGDDKLTKQQENLTTRIDSGRIMTGRSYCVTYVNIFGEESAPGNPSRVISVCDGDTVVITGLPSAPSSEYGVRYLRIYRSASVQNSDSGGTKRATENDTPAAWFMVAELPVGTASYADSTKELDLGWALQTDDYREPPADLRQMTYLRGTGVLAGVTTNMVHFSEPYQPWNWMRKSDLTLPYNIVHAVSFGTYLYVTTTANPYVIDMTKGCQEQCAPVDDVNISLPDIACGYAHSAVATPFGCVYVSKDGLALIKPDAQVDLLTKAYFSTEDWAKIRPETIRLTYWRGYIVFVSDKASFMLEVDPSLYGDDTGAKAGNLTTFSDSPVDLIDSANDELLMMDSGFIWQWNAGNTWRRYHWESRPFDFNSLSSPNSVKLILRKGSTYFTIISADSDQQQLWGGVITNSRPHRIGRLGRHWFYKLGLDGTGVVESAYVNNSYGELNGKV